MSVGSGYLLTALIFEPVATPIELTTRAKYFTFVCLSFQVLDLDKRHWKSMNMIIRLFK